MKRKAARLRAAPGTRAFAAALILATFAIQAVCADDAAIREPLTIDDLLRAEDLEEAWFSPDGEHIAFTRSLPIAGRPTGGLDDSSLAGSRAFVAARRGAEPAEILGRAGAHYRLAYSNVWAPDGRGLLLLETVNGAFGLAYWDLQTRKVISLPGRPDSSFAVFDWAKDRIVYAVLPHESRQSISNAQMLERLQTKWRAAWTGPAPQITVSSANPVFETTEPPPGALMIAHPTEGTAAKIADGDYVAVIASNDGARIAAIRSAEDIMDSFSPLGRRGELQVFEVTPKGATQIQRFKELDVENTAVAWSPSGDRLLVAAKAVGEEERQTRLIEIGFPGGKQRAIELPQGGSVVAPGVVAGSRVLPIGWIGTHPAAVIAREGVATLDPPSVGARLDYGDAQDRRLDVYAFAEGSARNLTEFSRSSVDKFLAPQGAAFALVIADGALWRVASGRSPQRLSPDLSSVEAFGLSSRYPQPPLESAYFRSGAIERVALFVADEHGAPKRRVLDVAKRQFGPARSLREFVAASPDLAATVTRITERWAMSLVLNDGADRTLATVNAALSDRAEAPVRSFAYTSGDRSLTGWVVLPPGTHDRPLPAIVSVYGGTVYAEEPPTFSKPYFAFPVFSGQLLAMQGYAVVYPGTPLGAGEDTDVMEALAEHAVAAVDALASAGTVDPKRVGVMGQSFGGFSTAAILAKRSDRFKAGVALAGVYDWIYGHGLKSQAQTLTDDGRNGSLEAQIVESGQIRLGKPFWKDPAPYIRNSPIFHVENIDSPLLLLQGDLDLGVTGLAGAERMYSALVRAGKKPALVRYWGEGHVAQSEWAVRDQWSRITTWFGAYLKPLESGPRSSEESAPDVRTGY